MVPVNIRKIIISDLKKGIKVNEISRVLDVNKATIYRTTYNVNDVQKVFKDFLDIYICKRPFIL